MRTKHYIQEFRKKKTKEIKESWRERKIIKIEIKKIKNIMRIEKPILRKIDS